MFNMLRSKAHLLYKYNAIKYAQVGEAVDLRTDAGRYKSIVETTRETALRYIELTLDRSKWIPIINGPDPLWS